MNDAAAFAIRIGPFGPKELHVEAFQGREEISGLYRYDVTLLSPIPREALEPAVLSRRVSFSIRAAGHTRTLHGVISKVRIQGFRSLRQTPMYQYVVRVVPRAALLKHRAGSRIFRHQHPEQVIGHV